MRPRSLSQAVLEKSISIRFRSGEDLGRKKSLYGCSASEVQLHTSCHRDLKH